MSDEEPRNRNRVITDGWSNPDSRASYEHHWPGEPKTADLYRSGRQCDSCLRFVAFNADWGLCSSQASRHFTETVFEHFTCPWFENLRPLIDESPVRRPKRGVFRRPR